MKCKNCQRVFDYEKYYGICPKCGTFNRREQEAGESAGDKDEYEDHIRFHEQYDTSFSRDTHTFVDDGRAAAGPRRAVPGKRGIGGIVYVIVCCCILFGSAAGLLLVPKLQEKQLQKEAVLTGAEVEAAPYGETFSIGLHTVEVTGVRILENADVRPEFPEGEMCIAVSVSRKSQEEYPSYLERLEAPYLAYEGAGGNTVYKEAIDSYDFDRYEDYYGIEIPEDYDFSYGQSCQGELVYFVDRTAERVTLCFEERIREDDAMEKLAKIYEVEIALPKGVEE